VNIPFNFENIQGVEFFVCLDGDEEEFWHVPADADVQTALREMLLSTRQQLEVDAEEMALFEPGEKYGAIEPVVAPLEQRYMDKIRAIYQADHFDTNSQALEETDRLAFYFAGFHDDQDRKLLGVRRATQFKGILRARSRLVSVLDDTLKLVDKDIFRLDVDFDYLVAKSHVFILRPSGFEYTAGIDAAIGKHAIELLHEFERTVRGVNFLGLENYVKTHRRAGRLVASLRARDDLAQTSATSLKRECKTNLIETTTTNGKIGPKEGSEMAFLELLDRRRYTVELIDDQEEYYVAASRRGGKTPPAL
jgi:hypothetical protein